MVTRSWLFLTSTKKEASPMAEIWPEPEPRSVASLNKLLCGWEASASDEIATPKHVTNTVRMNRGTRVKIARKRVVLFPPDHFRPVQLRMARRVPKLQRFGVSVSEIK